MFENRLGKRTAPPKPTCRVEAKSYVDFGNEPENSGLRLRLDILKQSEQNLESLNHEKLVNSLSHERLTDSRKDEEVAEKMASLLDYLKYTKQKLNVPTRSQNELSQHSLNRFGNENQLLSQESLLGLDPELTNV